MAYDVNSQGLLLASNGYPVLKVKDLKFLELRMESIEKDIRSRKAFAWRAVVNLKVRTSNLSRGLKTSTFVAGSVDDKRCG